MDVGGTFDSWLGQFTAEDTKM